MRAGQVDAGGAHEPRDIALGAAHPPALAVAPAQPLAIPPAPVAEMRNAAPVRSPAMLATPLRATEPDRAAEFAPVDRVEPAMMRSDWHSLRF